MKKQRNGCIVMLAAIVLVIIFFIQASLVPETDAILGALANTVDFALPLFLVGVVVLVAGLVEEMRKGSTQPPDRPSRPRIDHHS